MRKVTLISCLILFAAICFDQTLAHSYSGLCGTLYLDLYRQGGSYNICHHGNLNPAFDNKVSSIYVPDGFNMRLFQDPNKAGKWIDIRAGVWNATTAWDNVISSVLYNNWGDGCANFYSGPSRTGSNFLVCDSGNLVPGWNDQVSSVYVAPNHHFRLFKGYNQTGEWIDVRSTWTARAGEWVNEVKSMKLNHWATCAFFHQYANQGGRLFQVCDSGTLPAPWNTNVSSITVPANMTLTIYNQANYTGSYLVLTQGVWNAPATWDKKVVSAQVNVGPVMGTNGK